MVRTTAKCRIRALPLRKNCVSALESLSSMAGIFVPVGLEWDIGGLGVLAFLFPGSRAMALVWMTYSCASGRQLKTMVACKRAVSRSIGVEQVPPPDSLIP